MVEAPAHGARATRINAVQIKGIIILKQPPSRRAVEWLINLTNQAV